MRKFYFLFSIVLSVMRWNDIILKAFFFSVSLLASNIATQAQNSWAMAMIEDGENLPSFKEFRCKSETGANGIDYLRIYDYKLLPGSDHSAYRLLSILGGMATLWVEYG